VLSNLATEWMKLGHRVTFLSPEGGGKPYFPTDAEVIWFNAKAEIVDEPDLSERPLGYIEFFLVMRKAILAIEKGYDVVLLNHSLTVWPSIAAGVRKKCFYYIQLYEPEVFFAIPSVSMKILSAFLWATYYAIPKQKCFVNSPIYVGYKNIRTAAPVVPPGIDLDLYWKKPFEGFPENLTIGIIGRKDIWKGTAQAVDSVKELISRGFDVRLKVAYAHHLSDSELKGLEGRIEVVVPKNDKELADFYRSVDIVFALATIQLGAPHYPVIESMACGTPVVTTGYFPGDDSTTFLVPVNDSKSVADCVEKMVGEDVSVISHKIDLAREKVLDLSWENVSSIMIKHICLPLMHSNLRFMHMSSNVPVFLIGSERSGTTLLRLMLDHHPEIAFNLESEFLVTQISDDGAFPNIGDYCEFLRNDRVFQHSHFEIKDNLDFMAMVNNFLEQKRTRDKKAIVGATIHYQFNKIGRIWPKAKYIYLFRDGRDVANSMKRLRWAGNTYVAADRWLEAEVEWGRCRGTIPDGSWIEVRYEDIASNPVEHLTRICHFLGVDYSDRIFDYVKNGTYEAPNVNFSFQWKKRMSKEAIQKIEAKIGDRLLLRGYELSGYPKITISKIEKRYLNLHSKISVFLYRIQKYGPVLVIREIMARRLRLKGQLRRIKSMFNKIDDAYLQ